MRSCKRSVMAIAMLVVISMPLCIFIFWKMQQLVVKHEMREKLGHAQLQTIEIAASDVHWHEENREILVDGKLFDVASQTPIPGTNKIRFVGLFDEEETELEYKTGRLVRDKEKNEEETQKLLVQAVWLFNSPLQNSDLLDAMFVDVSKKYSSLIADRVPLVDIAIPAPPPKA
jgi:hypothetical protein